MINIINVWGWLFLTAMASTSPITTPNYNATDTASIQAFVSTSFEGTPLWNIAECESGEAQYDSSGAVLTHFNSNHTWDMGYLQLNSSHLDEAKAMGLNLDNPYDNITFGIWLYENQGTAPWIASKECWDK